MSDVNDIEDNETPAQEGGPSELKEIVTQSAQPQVRREPGVIPEQRRRLVKTKLAEVKRGEQRWSNAFKRMKEDEDFLFGIQWEGSKDITNDGRYVVNIVQRHVRNRLAAIYAKNPTVVAKAAEKMDFEIWDETPEAIQQAQSVMRNAQQLAAQPGMAMAPVDPQMQAMIQEASALLADVQKGMTERKMRKKIARTLELYFKNKVLRDQFPPFKTQMKHLIRRVEADGVAYVKLGFARENEKSPELFARITNIQEQLATIERLMADMSDPNEKEAASGEAEELRLALERLQSEADVVVQEGLVFDFPVTRSIIPDPATRSLTGFVGARWVAEKFLLFPSQVQEIWNVDVGKSFKAYCPDGEHWSNYVEAGTGRGDDGKFKKGMACVYQIYDRPTGLVYIACEGYPDFLEEPAAPKVKLERFWPWFPLAFNETEHENELFPVSDVRLLRGPQQEYNRSRQGLREHRHASRPMTVLGSPIDDEDAQTLEERPANAVVHLKGLAPGAKVQDMLQAYEGPPIRKELYDTAPIFEDVLRSAGSQEANFGPTSGATATESSISEGARVSTLESNKDDLDDLLTELMRAAGQIALIEVSVEAVKRIVGRGAAWPVISAQDVAEEIYLDIAAGSSGRPNKATEIQNFTQMAPILMQVGGISPIWLAKQGLMRMDDSLDLTEAIVEGLPSIQAMNAVAGKQAMGAPSTGADPNGQGNEGATNGEKPDTKGGALGPQAKPAPNTDGRPPVTSPLA